MKSLMEPPRPKPRVSSLMTLLIGGTLYLCATFFQPSLLVFTYLLSKVIPYLYRLNDDGDTRRKLWKTWSLKEDRPEAYKPKAMNNAVNLKESLWMNRRGMALMTSVMIPKDNKVKAVVCLCHGFNDNSSYIKRIEYLRLIRQGIAVVTIEYEGHGRSDGLLSYIEDWNLLIDDASDFFTEVLSEQFPGKKAFLMGESMGGSVCYYTYERNPKLWSGVVFLSPMLKVSDALLPPAWVVKFFDKICGRPGTYSYIGWLPIAPTSSVDMKSFHLPEKRLLVVNFPCLYGRQPRLATARELLNVTKHISTNYKNFDAPFIILHGKADKVTDPDLSQIFYDGAKSTDKALKLYDGLWHSLTCGETDADTDIVFKDAIEWILKRAK